MDEAVEEGSSIVGGLEWTSSGLALLCASGLGEGKSLVAGSGSTVYFSVVT